MTFSFGFKRLLHAEPDYRQLFMAGLVNGIGDRFSQVAMLALILGTTGSGLAVGLALGLRVFPFLLLAPLGYIDAAFQPANDYDCDQSSKGTRGFKLSVRTSSR